MSSGSGEAFTGASRRDTTTTGDGDVCHLDMYEAGGEQGSDFRIFNASATDYHRADVLQRTGAIDISCELKRVTHGALTPDSDQYATLMVMQWSFKPQENGRRIIEATIKLKFRSEESVGDIVVKDISFNDSYNLLGTTQKETVTTGGNASVGAQYGSISGKFEKTVEGQTSDAVRVNGGMYVIGNRGPRRKAKWTLRENASSPAGIPASLTVAVLVTRDDEAEFFCDLKFKCKTDVQTALGSLFRKIPRDDPIILQPDPRKKGTGRNKNVTYEDEQLGSVDLEKLGDVTFATLITNSIKTKPE